MSVIEAEKLHKEMLFKKKKSRTFEISIFFFLPGTG